MMSRRIVAAVMLALLSQPAPLALAAGAEVASPVSRLSDLMQLDAVFDVLREEGLANGRTLGDDLFQGQTTGGAWTGLVDGIYDQTRMRGLFDTTLRAQLAADDGTLAAAEAFFATPLGQRILQSEIAARRALLDKGTEAAAQTAFEALRAKGSSRLEQIERFVQVNDLIESNVMGALNANLAFLRGFAAAEPPKGGLVEEQMLSEGGSREDSVRKETTDWLMPFLLQAYEPLSDAEFESYIVFCQTAPGERLNAAFFAAFDTVFVTISADLGRAAALQLHGRDI